MALAWSLILLWGRGSLIRAADLGGGRGRDAVPAQRGRGATHYLDTTRQLAGQRRTLDLRLLDLPRPSQRRERRVRRGRFRVGPTRLTPPSTRRQFPRQRSRCSRSSGTHQMTYVFSTRPRLTRSTCMTPGESPSSGPCCRTCAAARLGTSSGASHSSKTECPTASATRCVPWLIENYVPDPSSTSTDILRAGGRARPIPAAFWSSQLGGGRRFRVHSVGLGRGTGRHVLRWPRLRKVCAGPRPWSRRVAMFTSSQRSRPHISGFVPVRGASALPRPAGSAVVLSGGGIDPKVDHHDSGLHRHRRRLSFGRESLLIDKT